MNFSSFWYIVAPSEKLASEQVIGRKVLGEWLAIFRGPGGEPVAMRDRCMHRNAPLSKGFVKAGQVQCPYHGWVYDRDGMVVAVPAEGDAFRATKRRCAKTFPVREQDGYVYVRLDPDGPGDIEPYRYANYQRPGWNTVRLVNRFSNNVTNCAENFIDIPHTSFVHDKIFRIARSQKIHASIRREDGAVKIDLPGRDGQSGLVLAFSESPGRAHRAPRQLLHAQRDRGRVRVLPGGVTCSSSRSRFPRKTTRRWSTPISPTTSACGAGCPW